MNVCDMCEEMGTVNCKHCRYGNPCLGCADYSEATDTCESHGGCGVKRESTLESVGMQTSARTAEQICGVNRMDDLISRQAAIDALENTKEVAR